MGKAARLGDTSSHGGVIISASTDVIINGKGAARENDLHSCPEHGVTPLVAGLSNDVIVNGRKAAVQGMTTAGCGALIIEGSDDVLTN